MDRIYHVTFTVTRGTPVNLPQLFGPLLEDALLVDIELLIPPGHCGFTGLRIRSSRQQIIPWGTADWIIADNYNHTFPVNSEIGSRAISVQGYNTDVYDHTFYLRFHLQDLGASQASGPMAGLNDLGGSLIGASGSPNGDLVLPDVPALPALPSSGLPALQGAATPAPPLAGAASSPAQQGLLLNG